MKSRVGPLPHSSSDFDLRCSQCEFARSHCDTVGFLWMLQFPPHPKYVVVSSLTVSCKWPLVSLDDRSIRGKRDRQVWEKICCKGYIIVRKQNKIAYFDDHCPLALSSTIMKCFQRLVMALISSRLSHGCLEQLDNKDTNVRLLFIDNSSAVNTIIPTKLISKLRNCMLLHNWILDFLTQSPQQSQQD